MAVAKLDARNDARISLREIALEIGVSSTAAYRHFSDLDTLLAAASTKGFRDLECRLRSSLTTADEPSAVIRELCDAYTTFATERRAMYELMFGTSAVGTSEDEARHKAARDCFEILNSVILSLLGPRSDNSVRTCAKTVWSTLHGIAMLEHVGILEVGDDRALIATNKTSVIIIQRLVGWLILERIAEA